MPGERNMTILVEAQSSDRVRVTDPTGKKESHPRKGWLSLFMGEEG